MQEVFKLVQLFINDTQRAINLLNPKEFKKHLEQKLNAYLRNVGKEIIKFLPEGVIRDFEKFEKEFLDSEFSELGTYRNCSYRDSKK